MKYILFLLMLIQAGCTDTNALRPASAPQVEPTPWNCGNGFVFDAYVDDQRAYLDIPGEPLELSAEAEGVYSLEKTRFQMGGNKAVLRKPNAYDCEIDNETVSLRRSGFTQLAEGTEPQVWQLRIYRYRQPLLFINGALAYSNEGGKYLRDRKEGDTHVFTLDARGGVEIRFKPGVCMIDDRGPYPVTVRIITPEGVLQGCGRYL